MTRIYSRSKGDGTIEDMNELAKYLLNHRFARCETENSGFQESSYALCDYEVHVIRKKHMFNISKITEHQTELLKSIDERETFVVNVPKGFGKQKDE